MTDRRKLLDSPERRSLTADTFELRSDGNALTLTGYASVFDHPYEVLGGPPLGWTESVDRRAFDKTLAAKPDLHLLINHEGMPLARTKSGTLHLSTDSRGLLVSADLDRRDPDVQRLETKMSRGDMDEMSFAFRVKADQWSADDSKRNLTEVSLHKGDVSVVNFGANPATSAQIRGVDEVLSYLTELKPEAAMAELRAADGGLSRLAQARAVLAALERSLTPPKKHTLSLAEARAALDGIETRADHGNITTPDSGDLNAAARKYAASQGWAMPDGSYPIRPKDMHGAADLDKAVKAVGRGGGSHDAIRKHIMARAKAIGLSDAIPDDWNADGSITN